MRLKLFVASLLVLIFLGACGEDSANQKNGATNNDKTDIKELVEGYTVGDIQAKSASITSHELIVTENDDSQLVYELPEDEFFVSIAPFVSETHPCDIHSLTGCQGEMVDQDLEVHIEDMDGQVIVDETMNSRANGFIDLWLPRDQEFNVTITHEGKETASTISTFENDGTCITTMQLS